MIMNLNTAEMLIFIITFIISYVITVSITGFLRAWIALKLGDTTAQQYGFLTLNPLVHIDWAGMLSFLVFKFGWGESVPVNYSNIIGRFHNLKRFISFFLITISSSLMAIFSFMVLRMLFDNQIMFFLFSFSHRGLAYAYAAHSSFVISLGFVLLVFTYLNTILAAFYLVVGLVDFVVFMISQRDPYHFIVENYLLVRLFVPFLVFYFYGSYFYSLIYFFVQYAGIILLRLLHLI